MLNIIIRTGIIYIFLICFIRLTGKRQIGELQISELVTTIILSEIAAMPIAENETPLLYAMIPILLLISLEIVFSFASSKLTIFKRMFEGSPSVLMKNGKLDQKELLKQRINISELISTLRENDCPDISSLSFIFLEQNGKISAFSKDDALTHPIIADGEVNKSCLGLIGKDSEWLKGELKSRSLEVSDVFLMASDGNRSYFVIKEKEKT